jgi:uncharacterized damage-inducible protein DinB
MKWTELIKGEIQGTYGAAEKLLALVDEDKLNWKPPTGSNWMTTGQLIQHMTDACGAPCRGFVTGDWGFPAGADPSSMPQESMLPPAEKMPSVASLSEARKLLQKDKELALAMLAEAGENGLENKTAPAPWDPRPVSLGLRLLQMVGHLNQHKGQLYYYLKLQGKPVNTMHLWGM